MSLRDAAKKILPRGVYERLARTKKRLERARVARLPQLTEQDFARILAQDLRLETGDAVFVHSSTDQLNLSFPFYRILSLVREAIGAQGTVLFPTFPNRKISSYEYLQQGTVFDVRRTPSYIGLLTEFARRQRGARRSLHPTKSVCAIGPLAEELVATHQRSPYPYDAPSPFYKLVEKGAKIVGLGTWTNKLTFVYTACDALREDYPVRIYHDELFEARCVNYEGEMEVVKTYAQDMRKVKSDVPAYMKAHVPQGIASDLTIKGMKFFRADAAPLFDAMVKLAQQGITPFDKAAYSKEWKARPGI